MQIEINDDKMQAYLIFQETDRKNPPNLESIKTLLAENSIKTELLIDSWEKYFAEFQQDETAENKCLIAQGQYSQPGKDAWLEFFFDVDPQKRITSEEDGKVDFHNLDFVQNVSRGAKLVQLHEPTPGKPGKNILGEDIEVDDGKTMELPHCQNVEISSENPRVLIAKIDGHVRLSRNKEVIVEDLLTISSDIDFGTGNIEANASVVINGDVKSGFEVKATGDITIKGLVEDAKVVSGANILIKKGFIGHGKGFVKAAGDVTTSHVSNQQIVADGNIIINGEVIQGHLIAGEAVQTKGQAGNIVGGIVIAGTYVYAQNLGNENTTRTDVTIGADTQLHQMIKQQQVIIEESNTQLERVKMGIAALVRLQINIGKLPPDKSKLLDELKKARISLEAQLSDQEIHLEELKSQSEILCEKAKVQARDTIFPGVRLHYKTHNFPVKSMIKRETITPQNFYEFLEKQER